MANVPEELRYTKEHEWVRAEGDVLRVGVTAHAVEQLGDVTLIDLPTTGTQVKATERFGDIESVKTVSELFAPVGGEVVEVNEALNDKPELVNEAPYDNGWMITIRPGAGGGQGTEELEALMDAEAYAAYLGQLDD